MRVIALQGKHDTGKTRTLKGLKEIAAPEDQAAVNEKQTGELAQIMNETLAKWSNMYEKVYRTAVCTGAGASGDTGIGRGSEG